MRLALLLILGVSGLMLLPTAWLPLGLILMWCGWWVYERSPGSGGGDEGFIALLMLFGAAGAIAVMFKFAWDRLTGGS